MNFLTKKIKLEDDLSIEEFSEKIQHSPIAPEVMERFKDEARKVLQRNRILDYSQEFLLETMFFLYRKRGYRI